ncbi:hypothetical protein F383_38192 [Gossypium arboreum]|uniref:Uncharacterized protein n=1 Tax=Gossypium arboreum TaxID=29729 RepID=A0A0B0ME86_GOSAR|nr:hypothetical protein F383_38192 [Gossypium arboreum]
MSIQPIKQILIGKYVIAQTYLLNRNNLLYISLLKQFNHSNR